MMLLLCGHRLLLVVMVQLLLQFLGGGGRRLRLGRGADGLGHEGTGGSLAARAALATALCVPLLPLTALLLATRRSDASDGIGETGIGGGEITLRPETSARDTGRICSSFRRLISIV